MHPNFISCRSSHSDSLDSDDFIDVFGGPPQIVLCHNFLDEFVFTTSFYDEVFQLHDLISPATRSGQNMSAFRILDEDIFRSDNEWRSRDWTRPGSAKSKPKSRSISSSVVSYEDLSPFRSVLGDDVRLHSFDSKLKYIKNLPA